MAEPSDVRMLFYNVLKTYADTETFRIEVEGKGFTPTDRETWLQFYFRTARPSKPYAGTKTHSTQKGFFQVNVIGPENRLQKKFEQIAWEVAESYWPGNPDATPTLGTAPLVKLGPTPPHVKDMTAPGEGRLGSIMTLDWHSDFPRA